MRFCLRICLLLFLVPGTLTQDALDLSDALEDLDPKPKPDKPAVKPPKSGGGGFDLEDALGSDPTPDKPAVKPPKSGGGGFDLEDAVDPDPNPKPDKPTVKPPKSGGDDEPLSDLDLFKVSDGDYKPDGGRSGGGHAVDPGYDPQGGADQPQDPDLLWGQILKMLNANIPEEFYMWMSNLKHTLASLLERAMNLLQAMP